MPQSSRQILVPNFHGLGPIPSWVEADEAHYWCEDPARFGAALDDIVAATSRRSIEITFDDGNLSDHEIAMPALLARGLTAKFFICAGRIGTNGYLDGAKLRAMHAAGMGIGSHGWSHVDWRTCSETELHRETADAARVIEDALGAPVTEVAIPFGSYNRRAMAKLAQFQTIYTSDRGFASRSARIIPRVAWEVTWTDATVANLVDMPSWSLRRAKRDLGMLYKRWR